MEINRRMVIGGASAGVALSLVGEARAQASAGANGEQKLLRSIENTPWVATQSDQKKVAYVLWAPWCPYCQQVMKDVVAGSIPDLQIRWIGAGARNGSEAKAIAQVAKANSTEYLRKVVLRQDAQDVEVNPAYIQRVNSSD